MADSWAAYRTLDPDNAALLAMLRQALSFVGPPETCYVMAETWLAPFFGRWDELADWMADQSSDLVERGRLFGPHGEVQWRPRAGQLQALLLTDQLGQDRAAPDLPPGFQAPIPIQVVATQVLDLWGEWDAHTGLWREGRLPRAQAYPLTGTSERSRPRLTVVRYREGDHMDAFVRYQSLYVEEVSR